MLARAGMLPLHQMQSLESVCSPGYISVIATYPRTWLTLTWLLSAAQAKFRAYSYCFIAASPYCKNGAKPRTTDVWSAERDTYLPGIHREVVLDYAHARRSGGLPGRSRR